MPRTTDYKFSRRIRATPQSMIREILKVTERPDVISFAGGLPSPDFLDTEGIRKAANSVLKEEGKAALQYSTTEGYLPLREWISNRYKKRLSISVDPDEILITNGSQQTLDLVGRIFIDEGDPVGIEAPGYLGAIQAFSQYIPEFLSVPLNYDGLDTGQLAGVLDSYDPVFCYVIPNSQNPSGITYSTANRRESATLFRNSDTLVVEDDAYGEIRFTGTHHPTFRALLPQDRVILLGSFSKIVAPGLRMGWICGPEEVIDHTITAKQASDLHSNIFSQRVLSRYLADTDIDFHIAEITRAYGERCTLMLRMMDEMFPEQIRYTRPDGGMFIWLTLPDGCSAMELWRRALAKNVAILPGTPFYTDGTGDRGVRLNFSNADPERIQAGISRLAQVLAEYMGS
ncbi:MAG TPA: PLP-dependent aminotransferase family protein [Methanoregulaceae archaeon]|nr:PLP-dependent aminotransferase family protein [Methanoregulaceae archaeon]